MNLTDTSGNPVGICPRARGRKIHHVHQARNGKLVASCNRKVAVIQKVSWRYDLDGFSGCKSCGVIPDPTGIAFACLIWFYSEVCRTT